MKKYYDENNYIVGVSFGELTSNNKEVNFEEAQRLMHLIQHAPEKKGYKAHLVETENGPFFNYEYKYEEIPASELPDDILKELLQEQIMNSVTVGTRPANKEGFILKPVLNGTIIQWEFIKNDAPSEDEDVTKGDYINPITYIPGMEVKITKWYTDGDNIWEAIASGIPSDFNDRNYFDII